MRVAKKHSMKKVSEILLNVHGVKSVSWDNDRSGMIVTKVYYSLRDPKFFPAGLWIPFDLSTLQSEADVARHLSRMAATFPFDITLHWLYGDEIEADTGFFVMTTDKAIIGSVIRK
jgi:hypothetical protein